MSQKNPKAPTRPVGPVIHARFQRGFDFHQQGNFAEAERLYKKVLQSVPDHFNALHLLGVVTLQTGRAQRGVDLIVKAIGLDPTIAVAHLNLGRGLKDLNRPEQALASYDQAIALKPDYAEAYSKRGNVLREMKRSEEALASFDKALTLAPDLPGAWLGLADVYSDVMQHADAIAAYEKALALTPDLAEAWLSLGNSFTALGRYGEALAAYDKATTIDPNIKQGAGSRLFVKQLLCDWTDWDGEVSRVLRAIRQQQPVALPFHLLGLPSSPADQLQCARQHIADQPSFPQPAHAAIDAHDRIRVAYVSSDFHDHPVGWLTAGLFEQHDTARFEITGISLGPECDTELGRRIRKPFQRFVEARLKSDQDIADVMRELAIDIAVDLNGHTNGARPGVWARKPAPIQAQYFGYPGTTGADTIDYVLADATIIPAALFAGYSEKVVWLPDSFMVQDRLLPIAARTPSRAECGLPEHALVFCCFNTGYKITPDVFDIWMRLLSANDDSVLWLLENNAAATANLRAAAEKRGVAPARLIAAPRQPLPEHLARHRNADLFLDTLPYNAGMTAASALWMGVPVLTCLGQNYVGRMAASLIRAIGLPELVTTSLADYEAVARNLAREPARLAALKHKLARNRDTEPFFNTVRFTRHLEAAYHTMMQRHRSGEPPQHFAVAPMA